MAEQVVRSREWGSWAGSTRDLADAAQKAIDLLAQGTGRRPRCSIRYARAGLEMDFASPDEFSSEVSDADLPRTRSFRVSVGDFGADGLAVLVSASDRYGIDYKVEGSKRTTVEGVASLIEERLARGGRRFVDPFLAGLACGAVALGATLALIGAGPIRSENDPVSGVIAVGVLLAIIGVSYAGARFAAWVRPRIELHPAGSKTRWQRARRWTYAVVSLALAILGIVLAVLIP